MGARFLKRHGFAAVADLVAQHKDLAQWSRLGEAQILYLADKLVNDERIETIEARKRRMHARFADQPKAWQAAKKRLEKAQELERRVESATRKKLHKILESTPSRMSEVV